MKILKEVYHACQWGRAPKVSDAVYSRCGRALTRVTPVSALQLCSQVTAVIQKSCRVVKKPQASPHGIRYAVGLCE
jgi:hypothetical protein